MRKLVTLRAIDEIREHTNADALELAIVDGWQVVVKKGEFQTGDLALYFEIDSFLPADDSRFEFLRKTGVKTDESGKERIRLRTVKLRKEISQGLLLPWYDFPELHEYARTGDDLSEKLDVIKFERPEPSAPNAAGNFPDFIKKTDEDRIQNVWKKLSREHFDSSFIPTLKLDGTSCTIAYLNEKYEDEWKEDGFNDVDRNDSSSIIGKVIACSRNLRIKYDRESHYWKAIEASNLHVKIRDMARDRDRAVAIQGEVMGPGIQGNPEKLNTYQFFAFNVFDIDSQEYLPFTDAVNLFEAYGIQYVPIIGKPLKVFQEFDTIDSLLEYSDGPSINAKYREGIVWKSEDAAPSVSFKAISNKWLLKVEE